MGYEKKVPCKVYECTCWCINKNRKTISTRDKGGIGKMRKLIVDMLQRANSKLVWIEGIGFSVTKQDPRPNFYYWRTR